MRLSESEVWLLIGAMALITWTIKGVGPALVGGRELPRWSSGLIAMLAPALVAALVATSVLADGSRLALGADTVGIAVATVLLVQRVPVVVVCGVAVLVTALLRWIA